jgi:hypothetical protein
MPLLPVRSFVEVAGTPPASMCAAPPPYNVGSGELLGDLLICWGFLMKALDLKPGQSILEYGPGSGQILVNFARMGVRAAGIDIDGPQVAVIEEQGRLLGGLELRAKVRQFGEPFRPGRAVRRRPLLRGLPPLARPHRPG